jgi:hypothetical protein
MNRRHQFGLTQRGKWLVLWLNEGWLHNDRERRARARIEGLIDLLQKLQAALRPGTPLWKLPEVERIETDLNKLTRRYLTWPRFAPSHDGSYIGIAHMWSRGSHEETEALDVIEELLKAGLLNGLTFCETCKRRRVFRSGKKGRYCSTPCRQAPYEATAGRKALKAKRNREYYQRLFPKIEKRRNR